MRIASLNVENLFSRAKAMNLETWADGKEILTQYSRFNQLIQEETYTQSIRDEIVDALKKLGLKRSDTSKFAILRQNRSKLIKRPAGGGNPVVVADGREDWVGWVELVREAVNETATRMTAQVIGDIRADILGVIEAEDRIALKRFDEQLLAPIGAGYHSIMLIDGNDERGIDVGLMTRTGFPIVSMSSHVDDLMGNSRIFSRDCAEFEVATPSGDEILVIVNHLKSKGYGSQASSNARREAQATRVRQIYEERKAEGYTRIAVLGDFNDTPESGPLKPLLGDGSDLKDITEHPDFVSDGRAGTYKNGIASGKIDYVLLSPALFERVTFGEIFRKGVWGGMNGTLFPHYPQMTAAVHASSDHAAILAEIDLD